MKKVVGVKSAAEDVQMKAEEIQKLKQTALDNVRRISSKPTLSEMYKMVDDIWASGHTNQLIFQSKDQHYEYITRLYNEQIEPLSLEQYKKMVYTQTEHQFDALLGALDTSKQMEAYKLHQEYTQKIVDSIEDAGEELVERNRKANSEQREKIAEVSEALKNDLKSNH